MACARPLAPVLGRCETVQGRVLAFNAEDKPSSTRHRIQRMCRALGLNISELDLYLINMPGLRIDDSTQIDRLRDTIERYESVHVTLDPFRDLHGLDENDARVMSAVLAPLRLIQHDFGCSVQMIHHTAKQSTENARRPGQRLRGSGVLHGWIDSAMYLTRDGERVA